jgi:GTPase
MNLLTSYFNLLTAASELKNNEELNT